MTTRSTELRAIPWRRHLSESGDQFTTHNGVVGAGIHQGSHFVIVDGYGNIS